MTDPWTGKRVPPACCPLPGACPPSPGFRWATCPTCGSAMRSDSLGCTGPIKHAPMRPNLRLYATWTGTRANLAALHAGGFRVLTGPDQLSRRVLPPLQWAVDNGAWGCFRRGAPFDADAFRRTLDRWGDGADWIVLPDVVAGGMASLDLSLSWMPELHRRQALMLLPVQDGMTAVDVRPHLAHPSVGLFVGGSTEWKWRTLPVWGALAREAGCHLHVGRVNSADAIRACVAHGAHSGDGTSATLYKVNAPKLSRAASGPAQVGLPAW